MMFRFIILGCLLYQNVVSFAIDSELESESKLKTFNQNSNNDTLIFAHVVSGKLNFFLILSISKNYVFVLKWNCKWFCFDG